MSTTGKRSTISETHASLGRTLRAVRKACGLSIREVPGFDNSHVCNVEGGYVTPSLDYIETFIKKLGGDAPLLRSRYQRVVAISQNIKRDSRRGRSTVLELKPPQHADDVVHHSDVQMHYLREANDAHYVFGGNGIVKYVDFSLAVWAPTPGVKLVYSSHTYDADRRRGVLCIKPGQGILHAEVLESPVGAVEAYFELDRELNPSDEEPHVLTWRLRVDSRQPTHPMLLFHCSPGTQRTSVQATFTPPALPECIWWFSAPTPMDADHPRPDAIFPPESANTYGKAFDDLEPGWSYGLAWLWPRP